MLPGRKPEPLAGLDRRAGEDDALDLLLHQRADGQRHGQVGLAGARRADAEHDVVVADGVDVALLRQPLGRDGPRAPGDQDGVREDVAQVARGGPRATPPPRAPMSSGLMGEPRSAMP